MKIIVADDTKEVRESLCLDLQDAGHEVLVCAYPDQVEEAIPHNWADLLITDFDFGSGYRTGPDLIRDLRAKGLKKPVVLLSGSSLQAMQRAVVGIDGVTCIVKGLDSHVQLESFIKQCEVTA